MENLTPFFFEKEGPYFHLSGNVLSHIDPPLITAIDWMNMEESWSILQNQLRLLLFCFCFVSTSSNLIQVYWIRDDVYRDETKSSLFKYRKGHEQQEWKIWPSVTNELQSLLMIIWYSGISLSFESKKLWTRLFENGIRLH